MAGILGKLFDESPEAKFAKKLGISKQDLEAVFNDFDKDASGTIDVAEMEQFAGSLGLYWGGGKIQEIVNQMDTDKSGTIDLKEFATWFCEKGDLEEPRSESEALRYKLMFKVAARKVSKLVAPYLEESTGIWCSNKVALQTGDWDTANPRGMLKAYFCPVTSSELEGLQMPEGAKMAAFVDVTLREGVDEKNVALLADFLNQVFDVTLRPLANKMNEAFVSFCNDRHSLRMLPGLCNSKCPPFHSFKVRKQNVDGQEVLRCIGFSALDPTFLYKETGVNPGQFLPSIMGSFTTNHTIGDFLGDTSGQSTLKDWVGNGRLEWNMSWNTRVIKAVGSVLSDMETMGLVTNVMHPGKKFKRMGKARVAGLVAKGVGRAFKAQSMSMEMQFNGFEEVAEAMLLDVMFPLIEGEMKKMKKYKGEDLPSAQFDGIVLPFDRGQCLSLPFPTEDEVHAFVTAVGSISGADLKSFQDDVYTHAKFPMYSNGNERLTSPLFYLKEFLDMFSHIVLGDEDLAQGPRHPAVRNLRFGVGEHHLNCKALYGALSSTAKGIGGYSIFAGLFKAGWQMRGADVFTMLPSNEQLACATQVMIPRDQKAAVALMNKTIKSLPGYMRCPVAETAQFMCSGNDHWGNSKQIMLDGGERAARTQYEIKNAFAGITYEAADLDTFRAKYPGVVSVCHTLLGWLSKGVPSYDMTGYQKEEFESATNEENMDEWMREMKQNEPDEYARTVADRLMRPYSETAKLYEFWNHFLKTASLVYDAPFDEKIMSWEAPGPLASPYEEKEYTPEEERDVRDSEVAMPAAAAAAPSPYGATVEMDCARVPSDYYDGCAEVEICMAPPCEEYPHDLECCAKV